MVLVLIRLRGCAGKYVPLLFVCSKNQGFSRRGPRGGESYCFKHTSEWGKLNAERSIIGKYMEIWFSSPLFSNGLSHTD